jgi:bis(5'-nucleosyl)-tetraphosphatase (symmetrical)
MATYAIGDIQGCYGALRSLLDHVGFDPGRDRLWLTGDLVNRGPESLEVLRFVRDLGDAAVTVLGNHDLHLLAAAVYPERHLRKKDTLSAVLAAPDRRELLDWLRGRPLMHRDRDLGFTLVHAGIAPAWDPDEAGERARELEGVLRGPDHEAYFSRMYGDHPERWTPDLRGWDRLRFITNAFTRMRYCTPEGALTLKDKGPPGTQGQGLVPWYQVPGRRSRGEDIVFGHWSTLYLAGPVAATEQVWPMDTGCLWGGKLTALRLEDRRRLEVPCEVYTRPKSR